MTEGVDQGALTAALTGPGRPWRSVRVVASTGSTNADLVADARAGGGSGQVLIALHQAAGRGRFDRVWEAPPGRSLAISVLLRPELPLVRWPWLPLVTGVAVAEGLREAAGVAAEVKWPNDVLIEGRKVCGILAERVETLAGAGAGSGVAAWGAQAPSRPAAERGSGAEGAAAVVGMGINTLLTADQLPVPTATSLLLAGSSATQTEVALAVLTRLAEGVARLTSGEDLRGWYAGLCATIGRPVRVLSSPTESTTGDAIGVDEGGRLLVRTPARVVAFAAGDVHHLR